MKREKLRRSRAGLGALEYILIAIVVIVLVGMAWLFLSGFIGAAAVNPQAAIEQFDITVDSAGNAHIVLVVKNTGNVRIESAAASVVDPAQALSPAGPNTADPGKTITFVFDGAPGTFILGNQYTARVFITYANGATDVLNAQATAHP